MFNTRLARIGVPLLCAAFVALAGVWRTPLLYAPLSEAPLRENVIEPATRGAFFSERNVVQLEVSRDMRFGDLIETYQLEQSRRELAAQLRISPTDRGYRVPRRTRLTFRLTPADY
jgi:hypothetical protein